MVIKLVVASLVTFTAIASMDAAQPQPPAPADPVAECCPCPTRVDTSDASDEGKCCKCGAAVDCS